MKNSNVKSMLSAVEKIFVATQSAIDGLKDGDRLQVKELANVVALSVAMEPKAVAAFVDYFVHNSSLVYVSRGKNGGVVKGTKPEKTVVSKESADSKAA